ncbi:ABC transporter ATP-binding protein [Variovorax sp. YR752]|uniref:ABC transporter ATP-binding protein n=1 Tax=Variovorax sp. YR752 TaxID=1884383 RepID=UPI003137D7BD
MNDNLMSIRGLRAFYGATQALHGVDVDVARGGVTAILGANGAGKTTTLRAISGLVRAEGAIELEGKPLLGLRPDRITACGIAHVPDGRGTFNAMSVEENLYLGAYTRKDRIEVAADIERVYVHFPRLKERRTQQAGMLSGGEQQMLAISRALMLKPRILLLDEPSFGVAPLVVRNIFDILHDIISSKGVSVLLVEQNANLALEIADRAFLLETGRVVLSGSSDELRRNDTIRRSYLGA